MASMFRRRLIRPVLETYNHAGRLYRHPRAYGRQWSSYYGAEGGGFGWLTWNEDRPIGYDYPDLGFMYRTKLRKGLSKILFDGFIVGIEEVQGDRDQVAVTALGWSSVFEDDTYNRVFSDARTGQWQQSHGESGSFQPKKFDVDLSGQIRLEPRQGVHFSANDYTYVRYSFPFGSEVKRISFDYGLALPDSWPGKLEVLDSVGSLWSATATGSGSQALDANSGATYVEVRFTVTSGGENAEEDDAVYGQLTNAVVYGVNDAVVDASVVAKAMTAFLSADHGLSPDTTRIASPGRALPGSVVFSDDWTPKQIMAWCAGFGGEDDALLAWGVQPNDLKRVYLEKQDLATVRYVIRRGSGLTAQVKGDYKGSRQKIYAVYTDDAGQAQRTDDVSDEDTISDLGGHYRRGAFSISGTVDETTALQVIDMALAEEKLPQVTTSFTVRDRVYTATGKALPIDEVVAGGIVLVDEFRSREATLSLDDFRTQWSSFQLVGVEIDEDAGTARLIPAGDRRGFEQFMTRLAELQRAA